MITDNPKDGDTIVEQGVASRLFFSFIDQVTRSINEIIDGTTSVGAWAKISDTTPTAQNTVDITWDESLYCAIRVEFEQVETDTDNDALYLRLGEANGATIHTGAVYEGIYNTYGTGFSNLPETTTTRLATAWGNNTNESASGTIEISAMRDSNNGALMQVRTTFKNTAGTLVQQYVQAALEIASDVDTVRLYLGTGNFVATGTIRTYGLKI